MRVPRFVNVLAGLIVVLFLTLLIAPVAFGQDSTLVQVMVPTDTSLAEAVPEIPSSLPDLLNQYQLVIATLLGSAIVYLLAKFTAFSNLGDWPKRLAYLGAAIAVSWGVKALGGTMSADLAGVISTGLSGIASAVTGMAVFGMAKSQPNTQGNG